LSVQVGIAPGKVVQKGRRAVVKAKAMILMALGCECLSLYPLTDAVAR
jgi:hypothetical protein